jgi:hypothetical protein
MMWSANPTLRIATAALSALAAATLGSSQSIPAPAAHPGTSRVAFVGCRSDGQVGLLAAPRGESKLVSLPPAIAQKLAYYKAEEGFGVLAPRGWHCFSTYGSDGSSLFVSPDPIKNSDLFSANGKGFTGDVIQVSVSLGETSGRFTVARTAARIFPAYQSWVQTVLAEGIDSENPFTFAPYPQDKLHRVSPSVVEFETPANTQGLGTDSRLLSNSDPIHGVALLFGTEPNLLQVCARLPPNESDLLQPILSQIELDVAQSQPQPKPSN